MVTRSASGLHLCPLKHCKRSACTSLLRESKKRLCTGHEGAGPQHKDRTPYWCEVCLPSLSSFPSRAKVIRKVANGPSEEAHECHINSYSRNCEEIAWMVHRVERADDPGGNSGHCHSTSRGNRSNGAFWMAPRLQRCSPLGVRVAHAQHRRRYLGSAP